MSGFLIANLRRKRLARPPLRNNSNFFLITLLKLNSRSSTNPSKTITKAYSSQRVPAMKTINDLANKDLQHLNECARKHESDVPSERLELAMEALWEMMTDIYGPKFSSQYGEEPSQAWTMLLKGITPRQIKDGLNRLSGRDSSFPPDGIEFRALCLPETIAPKDDKGCGNYAAYLSIRDKRHPDYRPLGVESDSHKAKRKATGKTVLDNLKGILK